MIVNKLFAAASAPGRSACELRSDIMGLSFVHGITVGTVAYGLLTILFSASVEGISLLSVAASFVLSVCFDYEVPPTRGILRNAAPQLFPRNTKFHEEEVEIRVTTDAFSR